MFNIKNLHPALIIWPLAYIVFEFLSVNLIRLLKNKKIFKAGKDHLHYELGEVFNLSKIKVLIIVIFINLFFSLTGFIVFYLFKSYISIIFYLIYFILFLIFKLKIREKIDQSKF